MRTGTSDRSAAESWLIPMKNGWDKGKNKEQEEKGNENPKSREENAEESLLGMVVGFAD